MKRKNERSVKSKHCTDQEFVEALIFPSKLGLNVDNYIKNGSKKNETYTRLDCYHNRP